MLGAMLHFRLNSARHYHLNLNLRRWRGNEASTLFIRLRILSHQRRPASFGEGVNISPAEQHFLCGSLRLRLCKKVNWFLSSSLHIQFFSFYNFLVFRLRFRLFRLLRNREHYLFRTGGGSNAATSPRAGANSLIGISHRPSP